MHRAAQRALRPFAILAIGLFACEESPTSTPEFPPGSGVPPETVLLPSSTPGGLASLQWEGSDSDGRVVGYQYQLLRVEEEYYETDGESGSVHSWVVPEEGEGNQTWTPTLEAAGEVFGPLPSGSYLFRVRAVDDDGNSDPTPAEITWQLDPYEPHVRIRSGCGALYPNPSPLVMTIDISDIGTDLVPTPPGELVYIYSLYGGESEDCPLFWNGNSEWEPVPADGSPVVVTFHDLDGRAIPAEPSGEVACAWSFRITVRDPANNYGEAYCRVMILR